MATQYTAGLTAGQVLTAATMNQIGAAAETYAPTVGNLAVLNTTAAYIRINNLVTYFGRIVANGAATGTITVSTPTTINTTTQQWNGVSGYVLAYDNSAANWVQGTIQAQAGAIAFSQFGAPAYYNAVVPFVWAVNDVLSFTITYLAA